MGQTLGMNVGSMNTEWSMKGHAGTMNGDIVGPYMGPGWAAVGGRRGQCQDGQQELRRSARNCLGRPPGSHAEGESSRTVAGSAHAVVGDPSQYLPAGDAPLVAPVGDVLGGELTVGHAPVATVAVRARHGGCPVRDGYVVGIRVSSNAT